MSTAFLLLKDKTPLITFYVQVMYSIELQDLQQPPLLLKPTISISDTGQVPVNRSSKCLCCVYNVCIMCCAYEYLYIMCSERLSIFQCATFGTKLRFHFIFPITYLEFSDLQKKTGWLT